MNIRSIMAVLALVNASAVHVRAASNISKVDIAHLVSWIERTGKPRDDYNQENAVLIGLKPGEALARARGAQGKEGLPDRYIHLFSPEKSARFIVLKKGLETNGHDDSSTFKIALTGKVLKAYRMQSELDDNSELVKPKLTHLKINSSTRKAVAEEIAFWLARAKLDAKPTEGAP